MDRLAIIRRGDPRTSHSWVGGSPALIFGQGNKLRSDGPFLALLIEFERLLRDCRNLVVVGYSFRDGHVNSAISRWLRDFPSASLTVVDPFFPSEGMEPDDFRVRVASVAGQASTQSSATHPRGIIRQPTASALPALFPDR
jgi:hypothetical protein